MWKREWDIIKKLKIKTASQKWKTKFLKNKKIEEIKAKWGERELSDIIHDVREVRKKLKEIVPSPYKIYMEFKKEMKSLLNPILIRDKNKYSLKHECADKIKKFLKAGTVLGKWELIEDHKGDGEINRCLFLNIIAIGRGYAFIEHLEYISYQKRRWSSKRKNKFVLGLTEEGRIFFKSLPSNIPDQRIKEILSSPNPFITLNEFLTGEKIRSGDIIQGDILLKKLQKTTKKIEMKPTSEFVRGRHQVICNDMLINGNYILLKKDGMLIHPEHNIKNVPAGIYKVVKQKSYPIWDFSKSFKD